MEQSCMQIIEVLDHGYVELQDIMGNDQAVVDAARVSVLGNSKGEDRDKKLLFYLMEHGHMTPFEQVEFKFRVKTPLMVARQWFRHRTGHYNEVSRRYTVESIEFYTPAVWRLQDGEDKQSSSGILDAGRSVEVNARWAAHLDMSLEFYDDLLDMGVAKELARGVLPAYFLYTTFVFKIDARNLMHFLKLRMDSHAQYEIREYAFAIWSMFKGKLPWTAEAFEKFIL